MEISLNEPSLGKDKNNRLYPAAHTFEKMKRWEEIHEENPSIHFPKTAINKQDWYEVSIELKKAEGRDGINIMNYIHDASLIQE